MLTEENKLINPEVRIENTNRCNARCLVCPREKMTRQKDTMCLGKFIRLVDEAKELGAETISIFGFGEPLIDSGLEDKIAYCTSKGLRTFITTNGSLMNLNRTYDILHAGIDDVRFSIHSYNPLSYERIHGLVWLKVFRNFADFKRVRDTFGFKCKIHLTTIPMHGEDVRCIRSIWEKHCDFLEIWQPHNWGGAKLYRPQKEMKLTCGRPFNGPVQIQVDGSVIPCCFLTNSEVVLGNAVEDGILDTLRGVTYEEFRDRHRTGEYEGLPCETCDQRHIGDTPLLYSNRDPERKIGVTSTCKIKVL